MLETLGIHPSQLVINIISFLVLFFLLKKVLFAPINGVLEDRAERIKADRDEAERLRDAAAASGAQLEQRLTNIEAEARDRIQAAERDARAVREQLLEEARAERDKVVQAGIAELRREREKLLVEVRDLVADLSMSAAAKIVERELDINAHRALIDDIVEHGVK